MILLVIAVLTLVHILILFLIEKNKIKVRRMWVLIAFLFLYFFILPKLFYPKTQPDGINCGMPIMAITLAFWLFGGLASLITHVVYSTNTSEVNK